jgi:ankyrin repeat protein
MKNIIYTRNLVVIALFCGLFSACNPNKSSSSPSGPPSGSGTSTAASTASLNELIDAIKNKEIQEAKKIIAKKSVNLNDKDADGYTPLHYAVMYGQKEISEDLLNNGANVDELQSKSKRTALHNAALIGELELAKLLLAKGANINAQEEDGNTPLHFAYLGNDKDSLIVEELIKAPGINIALENYVGKKASELNVAYERFMASFLPNILPENITQLHAVLAVFYDEIALLKKLLAQRPELRSDRLAALEDNTLLMFAVENNKEPAIKLLLQAGANPAEVNPKNGQSAISIVLRDRYNGYERAKFLKDNGVTFSPGQEEKFKKRAKEFLNSGNDITINDVKYIIENYPDLLIGLENNAIENVFFTRIADETAKDDIDKLFVEIIKTAASDENKIIALGKYLNSAYARDMGIRKGLTNLLNTIPVLDQKDAEALLHNSFVQNKTYDDNHLHFLEEVIKKGANPNAEFGPDKTHVLDLIKFSFDKGEPYLNMYLYLLNKNATAKYPIEVLQRLINIFHSTDLDNVPNKEALGKEIVKKLIDQIVRDNNAVQIAELEDLKAGLRALGLI